MLYPDDTSIKNYVLSIRLAPDGFSFYILDVTNKSIVLFKSVEIAIHQDVITLALNALQKEDLFAYTFQEVKVLIDFPEVTTIPTLYFKEEELEVLYSYNIDLAPKEYVLSNHSAAYDLEVVFSVPKALYDFFNKNFTNIQFVHKLSLLLQQANWYDAKAQEQLFISYTEHHFTAVALRNNCLIYHNNFTLVCKDDVVYYLLLVFQEIGFDQYQAKVLIDGPIEMEDHAINVVREYVDKIEFATLHAHFSFPDTIKNAPSHYYSTLFNLPFCAL